MTLSTVKCQMQEKFVQKLRYKYVSIRTLKVPQMKTVKFSSSIDPDETAHIEP